MMNRRRTFASSSAGETPETTAPAAVEADAYETSEDEVYEEQYWDDEPIGPRFTWVAPALTSLVTLGWTGFFGWVHHQAMLAGAAPAQWIDWIVQWSVPMVLIIGLYLLAMRNSRREANRFSDAARALSRESSQLERRLLVVNRELALARNFIEAQGRDLETFGRMASENLTANASHIEDLLNTNSAQIESIGRVSETAVSNMEALRDQLPVIANSARDMNNQIGQAGNTAQGQVDALIAAFERLNTFGEAGEAHVAKVNEEVEATLRGFEEQLVALGDLASQRFKRLRAQGDEFRRELDKSEERVIDAIATRSEALARQLSDDAEALRKRESEASALMRERLVSLRVEGERLVQEMDGGQEAAANRWTKAIDALEERMKQVLEGVIKLDESAMTNARVRLAALHEEAQRVDEHLQGSMTAFEEDFSRRREQHQQQEADALAALEERLAQFDQRIAERQEEHLAHVAGLAERGEGLAERLTALDAQMKELGSQAESTSGSLSDAADLLADRLSQSRAVLEDNGQFLTRLTDDSVRLLEIIRSTADHSEGALSDAVESAEKRLQAFGTTAHELHELVTETETRGASLAIQLQEARETGTATREDLQSLEDKLAAVAVETEQVAERTSQELREAIELLSNTSKDVLENLRTDQTAAVAALAEQVAEASREQLAEAMRRNAETTIAELEAATQRADSSGRETARMLRDQLDRVAELADNLEQRVEYARARAEEQVDNDFSRRTALITEALHSAAIDITKAFDNDVGDTQWANYLRGDRGIFTRRAVRLLDRKEVHQIHEIYDEDAEFRDVVNRYIHDFEAMLRGVLSTRDGNAMAVTLLSSDMGKLYVILAQAIDRLRD
ncbi:ATPase [Aurantiacibacter sp. MUD11]|uniref:ATPase n=1 Tax=Aurantiacibacter sp. MUD11 TaxID=3003265 RepID=UPI0022AAF548|nr:ATPase [Aurantiacibacter sp. MUD11]WAT18452.1 ATPase [Aurantiacibacter sp. MUD11]